MAEVKRRTEVVHDEIMGRCLLSKKAFSTGEEVFRDLALLLSSRCLEDDIDDEDSCWEDISDDSVLSVEEEIGESDDDDDDDGDDHDYLDITNQCFGKKSVEDRYLRFLKELDEEGINSSFDNQNKRNKNTQRSNGEDKSLEGVKALVRSLEDHESDLVRSLDTARNFLQAIMISTRHMSGRRKGKQETEGGRRRGDDKEKKSKRKRSLSKEEEEDHENNEDIEEELSEEAISLFKALGPTRQEECTAVIRSLRSPEKFQHLFPPQSVISDDELGRLLGVLNNNQLQLELLDGAGIFPYACILQHDCKPNCSFSSSLDGTICTITAIRDIKKGERLSIDYGNNFYHPVRVRQQHLLRSYGFLCRCEQCTSGVDPFRAFTCPVCRGAMLARYPKAQRGVESGVVLEMEEEKAGRDVTFRCSSCEHMSDLKLTESLLEAEDKLCSAPPESFEALSTLLTSSVFSSLHYMCFWLVDDLAMTLAEHFESSGRLQSLQHATSLLQTALELLQKNPGVPNPHPEEVIFEDRLAQLLVLAGEASRAKQCYRSAHQKSCLCSGALSQNSLELLALATNPPSSARELKDRYHNRRPNS